MTEAVALAPASISAMEARLADAIDRARRRAGQLGDVHDALWTAIQRAAVGGKRVRARLVLETHAALGGDDAEAAIDAACAIELLHLAFVVHDDIIDGDLYRRGEPNVAGSLGAFASRAGATTASAHDFGTASALLAGDLLLTLAQSLLARLRVDETRRIGVLDAFDDAVVVTAAGEHADVWLGMHLEPASETDVLSMLERKTAAYSFQAPLELAARLAGSEHETIDDLRAIGSALGLLYQLRDDVLGVFGDERTTGKSSLGDLRTGKQTLLIWHASDEAAWRAVQHRHGDRSITPDDARLLREALVASGALDRVESRIAGLRREIDERITEARIPDSLRGLLVDLAATCDDRTA